MPIENLLQEWFEKLERLDKEKAEQVTDKALDKVVNIFDTELVFHGTRLESLYSIGYEGITSRRYEKENNHSHHSFWKAGYSRPSEISVFDPWRIVEIARQLKEKGDIWIERRFGRDKIDYDLFTKQHKSPDKILEKWENREEVIKDIFNWSYPIYLTISPDIERYISINPLKGTSHPECLSLRDHDKFRGENYRAGGGWMWESVVHDYIPKESILGIILTSTFYEKFQDEYSKESPKRLWIREVIGKPAENLRVPVYDFNGELEWP